MQKLNGFKNLKSVKSLKNLNRLALLAMLIIFSAQSFSVTNSNSISNSSTASNTSAPLNTSAPSNTSDTGTNASASLTRNFQDQKEVKLFIQDMVNKHKFDEQTLIGLFKNTKPEPKIIQLISKPYEAMPWYKYRQRMITEDRVAKGIEFWNTHREALKQAENQYGVPAEIIVAIIGVETSYGQSMGKYPVMQSLSMLAFRYPKRSKFFKQELEQYLLLCREEKIDPLSMYGSYAGAIGFPQFMPSSYRRYAVDFTHSGQRDLIKNPIDAIGSVANYFKAHGWKQNESVALKATTKGQQYLKLNTKDINPKYTLKDLEKHQVYPDASKEKAQFPANERAAFVTLKQIDSNEYWLGLSNFYVITRYNHSSHYAMAVYQLSQLLRDNKTL